MSDSDTMAPHALPAEPKPVLEATAFPHIVDNILEHLAMDQSAALALQGTCRAWKDKIRALVFAHIRVEVLKLTAPAPRGGWDGATRTTWYQLTTVPPPGGHGLQWPVQTERFVHSSTPGQSRPEQEPRLPLELVAASASIHGLDIRGPVPSSVIKKLQSLALDLTLVRTEEFHHGLDTPKHAALRGREYSQRCPQHVIWQGSPIRHRTVQRGDTADTTPPVLTIHHEIAVRTDTTIKALFPPPSDAGMQKRYYVICCPAGPPSGPEQYFLIPFMVRNALPSPVTFVGFETLDCFRKYKSSDPQYLWNKLLDRVSKDPHAWIPSPSETPAFMTHGEYAAQFGPRTYAV